MHFLHGAWYVSTYVVLKDAHRLLTGLLSQVKVACACPACLGAPSMAASTGCLLCRGSGEVMRGQAPHHGALPLCVGHHFHVEICAARSKQCHLSGDDISYLN